MAWRGLHERAFPGMTQSVILGKSVNVGNGEWLSLHAGSTIASSISSTGMSSRTGYTRRHSAHFKAASFPTTVRGFLHAGQTRISSRSLGIMALFYSVCGCAAFAGGRTYRPQHRHSGGHRVDTNPLWMLGLMVSQTLIRHHQADQWTRQSAK
jgi:hypothetical protein